MAGTYQVIARKWRPQTFADLVGQDHVVRTLTNAINRGRIAHAYLFVGPRGTGKTSTARIFAKALNCTDGPKADFDVNDPACLSIAEGSHLDVVEIDGASNNGVDQVRDLRETVRYAPAQGKFKVYIIDEVHMLSPNAFNALWKTLEEPPDHVKFLFATTEIEKVPVTVRSRCQRFDLRRIEPEVLINHLAGICAKEQVDIERDALALIARAAEGSVRDALSILDQAIAHGSGGGAITALGLRDMLGVADRARIIDLFEAVMKGDAAGALGILKEQYDMGADPAHVLTGLAEFVHFVTKLKLVPSDRPDSSVSPEEASRGVAIAAALSMPVLTRAWQLLTKGLQDMRDAPRPLAAADMVLVRLAYAADMPTPDDVLRKLASAPQGGGDGRTPVRQGTPSGGGGASAMAAARPMSVASNTPQTQQRPTAQALPETQPQARVEIPRFEDLVTLAQVNRDIQLKIALEQDVRLVRFERGSIEFSLTPGASPQLAQTLMRRLQEWTGIRWMVAVSREEGAPTLKEQADARAEEKMTGVRASPLVRKVLEAFPGAQIMAIRAPEVEPEPVTAAIAPETADGGDEVGYADQIYTEDDL
jgi:DNA polymerase-3 subunit gamma/tau